MLYSKDSLVPVLDLSRAKKSNYIYLYADLHLRLVTDAVEYSYPNKKRSSK